MTQRRWRSARGIGLLELCLALVVIALMSVGALHYYRVVERAAVVLRLQRRLLVLMDAVQQWRIAYGGVSSISISGLQAHAWLPTRWRLNEWGGEQTLVSSHGGRAVTFQLTGMPLVVCRQLSQHRLVDMGETIQCQAYGQRATAVVVMREMSGDA